MPKKKSTAFQKVKLKVGRKLPKGANVTDTSFKTKKIIVPRQGETSSHYKNDSHSHSSDISEVLNKLNNTNENARITTLKKIRSLLDSFEHGILYNVLNEVCRLVLAKEHNVRNETIEVIGVILKKMSSTSSELDLGILVSHIRCVMTDLDMKVRRDAMKLVDVVLEYMPGQICSSKLLLTSFLGLISRHELKSGHQRRSLTIAPNESTTAQEWRVCVLKRLFKFLSENCRKIENKESCKLIEWSGDGLKHCRYVYPSSAAKSMKLFHANDDLDGGDCNSDAEFITEYLSEIKPLLFGMWIEALPFCKLGVGASTDNDIEVLALVLGILCQILDWIDLIESDFRHSCFKEEYVNMCSSDVEAHIMSVFPIEFPGKKNDQKQEAERLMYLNINLNICKLFVHCTKDCEKSSHLVKIFEYLHLVLEKKYLNDPSSSNAYMSILKHFLQNEHLISQCEPVVEQLLSILGNLQKFDTILSFALDFNLRHLMEMKCVQEQLSNSLKCILYSADHDFELHGKLFSKLVARGHSSILQILQDISMDIVGLLRSSKYEFASSLVHKIPKLSSEHLELLAYGIRAPSTPLTTADHILNMLNSRFCEPGDHGLTPEDYFSFLYNVAVASFEQDVDKDLPNSRCDLMSLSKNQLPVDMTSFRITTSSEWPRQRYIFRSALNSLTSIAEQENFPVLTQGVLLKFCKSCYEIPVHSAMALLKLYNLIEKKVTFSDKLQHLQSYLSDLTLSLYIYEYALRLQLNADEIIIYSIESELHQETCNRPGIFNNIAQNLTFVVGPELVCHVGCLMKELLKLGPPSITECDCIAYILETMQNSLPERNISSMPWWQDIVHKIKIKQMSHGHVRNPTST